MGIVDSDAAKLEKFLVDHKYRLQLLSDFASAAHGYSLIGADKMDEMSVEHLIGGVHAVAELLRDNFQLMLGMYDDVAPVVSRAPLKTDQKNLPKRSKGKASTTILTATKLPGVTVVTNSESTGHLA